MRAVAYRKPFEVAVGEVPGPQIEHPDDVIVRIASTAICGSALQTRDLLAAFRERKRHCSRRSRRE